MSYGRTDDILNLFFAMQGSATGISLVDMQRIVGCSRRTAERLRDAALRAFPQIEELTDPNGSRAKRWHLPSGSLDRLLSLNADELLELRLAADELRHGGLEGRARIVETLDFKLRDLLPRRVLARIEPDLEALLAAEGLASRPGPQPAIRHEILAAIRHAITAGQAVRILYRARDPMRGRRAARPLWRRVEPLGVLYGMRHYLVAVADASSEPALWALLDIEAVRHDASAITKPPGFDLAAFAARSFGVHQEEPFDVVWRFSPAVAEDARSYQFHSSQTNEEQDDGALVVRFTAGGADEMCWHLFTWTPEVKVIAPDGLRCRYLEMLEAARVSIGDPGGAFLDPNHGDVPLA
jgi:predicted DNA-binding transcriptional regulator YafY